jgi:ATPase related to the helicase subunit of the Holliday junction resolvase
LNGFHTRGDALFYRKRKKKGRKKEVFIYEVIRLNEPSPEAIKAQSRIFLQFMREGKLTII